MQYNFYYACNYMVVLVFFTVYQTEKKYPISSQLIYKSNQKDNSKRINYYNTVQ